MGNITVVIGPPCSGKSTLVNDSAALTDVRIDYDKIATAIGSAESHRSEGSIRDVALAMRWRAIYTITEGIEHDAWVIHTAPNDSLIKQYAEAGANFRVVDPGIDVCIDRAKQDARPEETIEVIQRWYEGKERILDSINTHTSLKMLNALQCLIDRL